MIRKILITGAAGFIGSNLADDLLKSGIKVFGIDNFDPFYDRSIKEANVVNALKNKHYELHEGDIRDTVFVNRCLESFKPDIVIHLAARAGVRPSLLDPAAYYDVNVMGTLNILESMKKHKIRKLLFASSSSVYGNNKKVPFSESDNVDCPVSPYAASKKAGELLCHTFHHLYKMDIFCLRFFTVYGPRQRPDLAINKFTRAILSDNEITIYGDGTTSRDYTHINDIIQGIRKAIFKLQGFDVFNLGESSTVSLNRLVSLLEQYTGKNARKYFMPFQEGDVFQTYANINKAGRLLDYAPEVEFESGIRDYIKWHLDSYR
jgi:UDP-glucuronate 4-epimerase